MGQKDDQIKFNAKVSLLNLALALGMDLKIQYVFDKNCISNEPIVSVNDMESLALNINEVEKISFDFKVNKIIISKSVEYDGMHNFNFSEN